MYYIHIILENILTVYHSFEKLWIL